MMTTVTIQKNAKDLIIITGNLGGYKTGYCFACDASGWIDGYGYPNRVKGKGAHLQHKAKCPMNKVLNDNGVLKR